LCNCPTKGGDSVAVYEDGKKSMDGELAALPDC